ncbi:hypothetical protein HY251_11515, partial [bacterium]|nr:hypothetical protein [bacterium]
MVFNCPSCGAAIPFAPASAGKAGACPSCRAPVRAPAAAPKDDAGTPPTAVAETVISPPDAVRSPAASVRQASGRSPAGDLSSGILLEVEKARSDPAKRFGPFVLLAELGKGGMGVVYRAWNDRLRRVVALKTILSGGEIGEEAILRFHREAEAAARVRHPNVVSVHEAGEVGG